MFLLFVNSANWILGKNDLFDRSHDAASIVASLDSLLDLLEKMKVVFESWSVPKLDQNCQMPKRILLDYTNVEEDWYQIFIYKIQRYFKDLLDEWYFLEQ